MEASALFRTLTPLNSKLSHSIRFSSISTNHSVGGEWRVRRAYDALLLDAGGSLLQLAKPVDETYASIGRKYGLSTTSSDIKHGFKRAFSNRWPQKLRYEGDGRPFWKYVVSEATGCARRDYFEEVYEYYANGDAWCLPNGAYETLFHLKGAGGNILSYLLVNFDDHLVNFLPLSPFLITSNMVNSVTVKLAVVSNFDTRLRNLLKDLNVIDLFDSVIVSSEVGFEKPNANIFKAALDQIGVKAGKAVHIGDDQEADKAGANALGIDCWLWGKDVKTFSEIHNRILISEP